VKAPEKNTCDESEVALVSFSLVQFALQMSRKSGLFRVFHGQGQKSHSPDDRFMIAKHSLE
jgi:hypothetical protein